MLCPGAAMTLDKIVQDSPTTSPDGQRLDIGTKDTEKKFARVSSFGFVECLLPMEYCCDMTTHKIQSSDCSILAPAVRSITFTISLKSPSCSPIASAC